MHDRVRVKDLTTGSEFTATAGMYDDQPDLFEVIDKPAVDADGKALPVKTHANLPSVEELKGKALEEALNAAGLDTGGTADEKRARLDAYQDNLGDALVTYTEPGEDVGDNTEEI